MPTYEYKCECCHKMLEVFQKITAPPLRECPKCGGRLERLFGTGGGVIFKGSGFYATDYRSDSYKKGENAEKKSSSPPKDDLKSKT